MMRPRYTAAAKARDLAELAYAARIQALVLVTVVAPYARFLTVAVTKGAARIITSRYTDPQEIR